jgi:endonuclease YncB( thermonuclease family)
MSSTWNPRKARSRYAKGGLVVATLMLLALGAGCSSEEASVAVAADGAVSSEEAVERVIDGDTIALAGGTVVRLVQIDAPEVRGSDCYADEATATLAVLLPSRTSVRIETDPALDQRDRYGRTLAYVFKQDENVNKTLVEYGAASVWFYRGDRGRYAEELLAAAQEAQAAGRGLWGACQATLDPSRAVGTRHVADAVAAPPPPPSPPPASSGSDGCHPSYEPCLPIVEDLDCADVEALGKAPVRASGDDPYRLDGDGDGTGCE